MMETTTTNAPGSRGDFQDGVAPFNNGHSIEPFWNGFGNGMAISNNPSVPTTTNDMFLDDFNSGDYPAGSFQPGFLPNTITPQATYSESQPHQSFSGFQPNDFGYSQSTQNMQMNSNAMDFYLADGLPMSSSSDINLASQDPKSDTENEAGELHAPVKAKRGRRKGKKVLSKEEQAAKRQRFLARNRQAATKCRNRKKEWTQNLEEKAESLAHAQQALIMQLKEVEEEKRVLQRQITEHATCGNPFIQEYLVAQAAAAANPTPRPQYTMMKTASQDSERMLQGNVSPSLHMSTSHSGMRRTSSVLGSQGPFLDPVELSYQTPDIKHRGSSSSLQDSPGSNKSSSMSHDDPQASRPTSINMLRKISSTSTTSGITDSGISSMGSPEKFSFESHSDEGFASDGSIKMMHNSRHYSGAGLADLHEPSVYLRSFG